MFYQEGHTECIFVKNTECKHSCVYLQEAPQSTFKVNYTKNNETEQMICTLS